MSRKQRSENTYKTGNGSHVMTQKDVRGDRHKADSVGMGSHFKLWDATRYAKHAARVMQSPMPDALKSFSF